MVEWSKGGKKREKEKKKPIVLVSTCDILQHLMMISQIKQNKQKHCGRFLLLNYMKISKRIKNKIIKVKNKNFLCQKQKQQQN